MMSESSAVMRTSNSLPVQPSLMASCNEAMEFSGKPWTLNAPRCATTLLLANFMGFFFTCAIVGITIKAAIPNTIHCFMLVVLFLPVYPLLLYVFAVAANHDIEVAGFPIVLQIVIVKL